MAHNGPTKYAEIQQNEIDALKSIFMEDFEEEETRAAAWNTKADRRFRLKLWPLSGNTDHTDYPEVFAVLVVSLPTAYPKQEAVCSLSYGDSVPQKIYSPLENLVLKKARSLVGNEAIYEIAELVQEQLDEALTAITHTQSLPTLDEERDKRRAQAAFEAHTARTQRQTAIKEAERLANDARSAAIGRELNAQNTVVPMLPIKPNDSHLTDVREVLLFDGEMRCKAPASGKLIAFRTVFSPWGLRVGPVTKVRRTVPADRDLSDDLPQLALKSCEVGRGWDEDELKSQLSNILEDHLKSLVKLESHRNVLPVLGFQIQETDPEAKVRTWSISIVNEFMELGNLKQKIEGTAGGKLESDAFGSIIFQILEGLEFLQVRHMAHGRLSLENILLELDSTGNPTAKLTDIAFQSDLHSLKKPNELNLYAVTSANWQPPETIELTRAHPTTYADVWQVGVLILQMLFGTDVQRRYSSPSEMKNELELNHHLENLLDRIFKADPQRRPSYMDLRAHEFLRESYPALDEASATAVLSRVSSESVTLTPKVPRSRLDSQSQNTNGKGRYVDDFNQISKLGKGGFGQVVLARNKLDGQPYAVKKIISKSPETLQGVLGEVMLLSRLYHPNIVRYVTAWIEKTKVTPAIDSDESEDESELDDSPSSWGGNVLSQPRPPRSRGLDFISSKTGDDSGEESDDDIEFDDEDDHEEFNINAGLDDEAPSYDDANDDYGGIVFEDSEEHSGDSTSHDGSAPSTPKLAMKHPPQKQRRRASMIDAEMKITLYIQMEFCDNRTLRDSIKSDLSRNTDEYWRFLRQITNALDYVHGNGIIHRDLKPENIFVRGGGIRLGDFGLAKPQVKERIRGGSTKQMGALTASVGTISYMAPEVRSSGGGTYDEKADMYSLGVIFFEMCSTPGDTLMERAAIINNLHQEPPVLASTFDQNKTLEKDLIDNLLTHRPAGRPSAKQLLQLMPSEGNDESFWRQVNDAATGKNDHMLGLLRKAIFNQASDSKDTAKHYTYDAALKQLHPSLDEAYLLSCVEDDLIRVFRRHRAEKSTRQLLVPATDHWSDTVKVMDETGQWMHLPYDLTLPGARLLAKYGKDIAPCSTYSIGPVYRRSDRPAQHPLTWTEIDFDIIFKDSSKAAIHEAETIKVVDEIIHAVPALSSLRPCLHISHCDILDAILRTCKIPLAKARQVKDAIARAGHNSSTQLRKELRKPELALASTSVDDLVRFEFRAAPEEAIRKLQDLLSHENLKAAFSHLRKVISLMRMMKVKRQVYFAPLTCHNSHFYEGGLMLQCLFESKKKWKVICAGGRYDRLIREHAINRARPPCHAVGFQLSWEMLIGLIQRYQVEVSKSKPDAGALIRRGDIIVTSHDEELLHTQGVEVLGSLWDHGFQAGIAEEIGVLDPREEASHEWIVQVKQNDVLRVRNTSHKDDYELHHTALVGYLRGKSRDYDQGKRAAERPRLSHHAISGDALDDEYNHGQDFCMVQVQSRGKKTNRDIVKKAAIHDTAELTQGLRSGPIVAVELKDNVFESLRGLRVDDMEGWRKAAQHAELSMRNYVKDIHDVLLERAETETGAQSAFLYNFRSRATMLYDLTRKSQ